MTFLESFKHFWQKLPYQIDPVFLKIGGLEIRYYGLMFVAAIVVGIYLMRRRIKQGEANYTLDLIESYFVWAILGVALGGRLGYALFYQPDYYFRHPLEIFLPFDFTEGMRFTGLSGMSYHGGLIGVIGATYLFCKKQALSFRAFLDFAIPCVPAGYFFGRIGNFLNGELYGRATEVPWGMYFPGDPEGALRHPSQLYEAFGEGLVLFLVLWAIRGRRIPAGGFLGVYLVGYGLIRFLIEFFREPDYFLGFVFGPFSLGQVLCVAMVGAGVFAYGICFLIREKKTV